MPLSLAVTAGATATLGWIAGMWTLKRSQRWCPTCGDVLTCPSCRQAEYRSRTAHPPATRPSRERGTAA